MTTPDIYGLLPAVYRSRDREIGEPLKRLLSVVDSQRASLDADIAQLYDDMFAETCRGPLIERFAELIGVALPPLAAAGNDPDSEAVAWASRREQVIGAIAARAAKGTLTALERVASDATGWPVRAVEQGTRVAVTHSVRYPHPYRGRLFDIHDDAPLLHLGSAFSTASALPDARRGDSTHTKPVGPHPTTVALTVWREDVTHIHRAPAACYDDDHRYTFDALKRPRQLAVAPTPRRPGARPAADLDLPVPITRRQLRDNLADYYGTDRSLCIYLGRTPIPPQRIVVANLNRWRDPDYGYVAVDPETGRIAFPASQAPEEGVWVRYHRLDVTPLGAAPAAAATTEATQFVKVAAESTDKSVQTSISAAIASWLAIKKDRPPHCVIEILDSSLYEEDFDVRIPPALHLDIRAAEGQHPVLRSIDEQHNRPKRVRVEGSSMRGGQPARLSLSGITIAEHALELKGEFEVVSLDRCTIVPTVADAERRHVAIAVTAMPCPLRISASVIGWIRVVTAEVGHDPIELSISDSIIDAGHHGGQAISGADERPAYAALQLNRCTVLGNVDVFQTARAQDSIITGRFHSRRRQTGEVMFCYLPLSSHVPRRIECQPDGVLATVRDDLAQGRITAAVAAARRISEPARVRPRFDSTRYGSPGYGRLALDTAPEITHGSQDDGELGAFHNLWMTRRISDMTARLAEFTPIGVDLDIVFAT